MSIENSDYATAMQQQNATADISYATAKHSLACERAADFSAALFYLQPAYPIFQIFKPAIHMALKSFDHLLVVLFGLDMLMHIVPVALRHACAILRS